MKMAFRFTRIKNYIPIIVTGRVLFTPIQTLFGADYSLSGQDCSKWYSYRTGHTKTGRKRRIK